MEVGTGDSTIIVVGDSYHLCSFWFKQALKCTVLDVNVGWCGDNHSKCYLRIAMSLSDPDTDRPGLPGGLWNSCWEMPSYWVESAVSVSWVDMPLGGGEVMIVIAMHEQVRRRVQRMDAYRFRRTLSPLVMEWIVHRLMIELGYSTLYLLSEMDEFD